MKKLLFPSSLQLAFGTLAFPLAWLFPATLASALLTFPALFGIVALFHESERPYRRALCAGTVIYAIGFYWLTITIGHFGGFPLPFAVLLFLLFCVTAAVQFVLAVLVHRLLPESLDGVAIRGTVALLLTQSLFPRIFPWEFGHTLLPLSALVQSVDVWGTTILSLVALWIAEGTDRFVRVRKSPLFIAGPIFLLICQVGYGLWVRGQIARNELPPVTTALVQANVSIEEKHDKRLVVANVERYIRLTAALPPEAALVVWPETVIHTPFYANLGHLDRDDRQILPRIGAHRALLTGALTASSRTEFHNSAVTIWPDGTIPEPYHKRVLMPFGEYVPFGNTLPILRQLSGGILDLSPGKGDPVLPVRLPGDSENTLLLGPLICYEDVVPGLAQRASRAGAEVLVNITNDAWFGDTVAPYQHHLIASYRAIENRRTLLRATNTGFTAVVDPFGKTVASLKPFSDGTLVVQVNRMKYSSLYSGLDIESSWKLVWLVLGGLLALSAIRQKFGGRRQAAGSGKSGGVEA